MHKIEIAKRERTGGRPQLTDECRRQIRVQPSFTLNEFEALEAKACSAGLNVSEWLRTAGLGLLIKSVPTINKHAYSELSRLSANINQIAFVANSIGEINGKELVHLLTEIYTKVQQLRAELINVSH